MAMHENGNGVGLPFLPGWDEKAVDEKVDALMREQRTTTAAIKALTVAVSNLHPPRAKLDTLAEAAIKAQAKDAAHDAAIALHEQHITRLWKAVGAGSAVTLAGVTLGTLAFKALAAHFGLQLP